MKFSEKIKKLRTDNGLSQQEFADKIFVSRTAVSKWETDNGYPSVESLRVISETFGVSLDELFCDDEEKNQKLLQDETAKKFYFFCLGGIALTVISAVLFKALKSVPFLIGIDLGLALSLTFSFFATPKYKRLERWQNNKVLFVLKEAIVTAVIIAVFVSVTVFYKSA